MNKYNIQLTWLVDILTIVYAYLFKTLPDPFSSYDTIERQITIGIKIGNNG